MGPDHYELFEVVTWRQLGLHDKPIYLLNTNDYWDPLIVLIKHVITQGFADASLLDYITVVPDAAATTLALRDALS